MVVVVAVIAALALLPIVRDAWRMRRGPLVTALAGIAWLTVAISSSMAPDARPPATNRPVPLDRDEIEFATSRSCRACHPDEHASWHHSYHRTMTQVATPDTIIPKITKETFEYLGERYSIEMRGSRLWVTVDGRERRVVQTTGSHHYQVFWYPTGSSRKLGLFPFCYKLAEQRWMPIDSVFILPPETRQQTGIGRWNTNCYMCHATEAEPRWRSADEMDTRVVEFGIACEACHGACGEHVAENANPLRRYAQRLADEPDDTVVNPARLDADASAEACGQCHALTIVREQYESEVRESGLVFRPGGKLEHTRVVISPDSTEPEVQRLTASQPEFIASKFWPDGVIRISGREFNGLRVSACFTHDHEPTRMTCLSCHEMHPGGDEERSLDEWADDQLGAGMRTNRACTQCHEEYLDDAELVAHTHHAPGSTGSLCYNCHMTYTTYGLQKAVRSHAITTPDVRTNIETRRPNACNQCHLDQSLGWAADRLQAWYGTDVPELDSDQRDVAAGALWALRGDAAQRAFTAWSMGWKAAREASGGGEWMTPYLAELMRDPYPAVRFIAHRSLREAAEFAPAEAWDFTADEGEREPAIRAVVDLWERRSRRGAPRLLIDGDGALQRDAFERLLKARDTRPVYLTE